MALLRIRVSIMLSAGGILHPSRQCCATRCRVDIALPCRRADGGAVAYGVLRCNLDDVASIVFGAMLPISSRSATRTERDAHQWLGGDASNIRYQPRTDSCPVQEILSVSKEGTIDRPVRSTKSESFPRGRYVLVEMESR